ncbi:MAG TPA: peptide chain release factor N(5)-glutamine methyltransferase [Opitutaceae bacterium]|nr:peptide chain release factor N(5)-glutamine methyltransferase [Opitutaceae bacterium]
MQPLLEIIRKTTDFLRSKGVESARLEAEVLVAHALGLKRMDLYLQFERMLTDAELDAVRPLVKRRGQREPLQHILGETDFFDLKLKTDRRGLIPRPETELLLEFATKSFESAPARILDLGTGTGAIALALAKFWPESAIVAVDRSADALALARENAQKLSLADRVRFLESDWFAALASGAPFGLIVSNPPYLTAAEVAAAEPEVRDHDPHSALVAERDGRADLETIIRDAPAFLAPGGLLALETGIAQHAALIEFAQPFGYASIESKRDLTDRERFLLLRR